MCNIPKFILSACLALLAFATGCARKELPPVSATWTAMGTIASISVPADEADEIAARRKIVETRWDELESALSIFNGESDISRINAAAGNGEFVTIGIDARRALDAALAISEASDGAFDPTVGPLMHVWGFRRETDPETPPTDETLGAARALVGWTNVLLNASGARLAHAGMRLDLGGSAKGFAIDEAFDALRAAGATNFLVNLGGNIRASGAPSKKRRGWRVGVRDPVKQTQTICAIELGDGEAVATSGDYERFVTIAGERYSHIMDARTGWPARGVAGVTVRVSSAGLADCLSTALFVLGPDEGRKLCARFDGVDALWVESDPPHERTETSGFMR